MIYSHHRVGAKSGGASKASRKWKGGKGFVVPTVRIFLTLAQFVSPVVHLDELMRRMVSCPLIRKIFRIQNPRVCQTRNFVASYREIYYLFELAFIILIFSTSLHRSSIFVSVVAYFVIDITLNSAGGVFVWGSPQLILNVRFPFTNELRRVDHRIFNLLSPLRLLRRTSRTSTIS